jgi:RNA polymerase sigma-70 factor (ECF subfamily)
MADTGSDSADLLARARAGDPAALDEIFTCHRDRLRRMVTVRLDHRLRPRVDPSDVLQEAFLEVAERLPEYLRDPRLSLFVWLRLVVGQRLARLHRRHLGVRARDVRREVPMVEAVPEASSVSLAAQLVDDNATPASAAVRAERLRRVQEALDNLDPIDREVLALRHFEQLSRSEAAEVLGIGAAAAAKRYLRALGRLRTVLADMPGGLEGL